MPHAPPDATRPTRTPPREKPRVGVGRSPIDLWREAPRLSPSLEGYDAEPLRRSFEHCRNALARGSRVMATRLRTIPEPRYSAAAALLTWVRAAREVIDGNWPPEARVQNLARFRDQTERAVSGKPPEHADPMWPALSAVVATYGLDPAWALTALDEMGLDLADRAVEDAEHFKACCRALGGNLGLCTDRSSASPRASTPTRPPSSTASGASPFRSSRTCETSHATSTPTRGGFTSPLTASPPRG